MHITRSLRLCGRTSFRNSLQFIRNQQHFNLKSVYSQEFKLFSIMKPALPTAILNESGLKFKEKLYQGLEEIEKELVSSDQDQRDASFRVSRKLGVQSHDLLQHLRNGSINHYELSINEVNQNVEQLLALTGNDVVARESRLLNVMEKVLIPKLLYHFYQTGQLLPPSALQPTPTDSEYLCAVFSFAAELSRYTINRACQFDLPSIQLSKELISEIYQALLEFDFRNGLLRRRFDSVKYSLKSIENIFYELHLQTTPAPVSSLPEEDTAGDKQLQKKPRVEKNEGSIEKKKYQHISEEEFQGLVNRMSEYDLARENLIKESRDIQKLAKQAIYAIIRQQLEDARKKLNICQQKGEKLFQDIVVKYPTLRQGSYSNSLEEYAEGELLYHWISKQELLTKSQFPSIVNVHEYVNGLADFTGEIGRLAVMYASERKLAPIQDIQQLDTVIYDYITTLNIVSNNSFFKKMDMIYSNMKKVDDIIYELTLLQKTGKLYHLMPTNEVPSTGGKDKDKDQKDDDQEY